MRNYNVTHKSDLPAQRYAAAHTYYCHTAQLYAAARCRRAEWLIALAAYREAQSALSRASTILLDHSAA
jgi:hypothetical protein